MVLRTIDSKDAPYMLEWMKDSRVNRFFQFDPEITSEKTVSDFIARNGKNSVSVDNYHFAVADGDDVYQGTVSLKNVSAKSNNAEYAISLRYSAQGKGIGTFATREILKFAFEELNLERIYLNVLSDNEKAIRLYEKFGFTLEGEFRNHVFITGGYKNLKWFGLLRSEYLRKADDRL